jgi:hypothetical protein
MVCCSRFRTSRGYDDFLRRLLFADARLIDESAFPDYSGTFAQCLYHDLAGGPGV